ncbi:hypothetical protein [Holospora curviuscula]|uniref:Uncharacterized protein n=1 Tax=Holospora curviuscula TaxID=1082868 RepID=A0A2S5R9K3_9PROT|nr:hypothetical protein [Holospora curviuscula]PPE04006.1 hypothetical protein HCUR_00541 [Holospora curviuscula]
MNVLVLKDQLRDLEQFLDQRSAQEDRQHKQETESMNQLLEIKNKLETKCEEWSMIRAITLVKLQLDAKFDRTKKNVEYSLQRKNWWQPFAEQVEKRKPPSRKQKDLIQSSKIDTKKDKL